MVGGFVVGGAVVGGAGAAVVGGAVAGGAVAAEVVGVALVGAAWIVVLRASDVVTCTAAAASPSASMDSRSSRGPASAPTTASDATPPPTHAHRRLTAISRPNPTRSHRSGRFTSSAHRSARRDRRPNTVGRGVQNALQRRSWRKRKWSRVSATFAALMSARRIDSVCAAVASNSPSGSTMRLSPA